MRDMAPILAKIERLESTNNKLREYIKNHAFHQSNCGKYAISEKGRFIINEGGCTCDYDKLLEK
jgi:hypothetical protein